MLQKVFRQTVKHRFLIVTLAAASLLLTASCKSGFSSGGENQSSQNQSSSPSSSSSSAPAPIVVDGVRASYADVVEKTSPAVVRIDAEHKDKAVAAQGNPMLDDPQLREYFKNMPQPQQQQPRSRVERGVGSGVIVSADGTILTNFHVVNGAEKITVTMNDNNIFPAKIVGSDQASDLAVLKIESRNLPFLNLGNSDNVRIGDVALAIGNPLGIGQTVTAGIISAKGRHTGLSDGSFEDFLQTDAPINRGNSGGALVNLSGELIGINSQIASEQGGGNIGIGFSIPSNMAKSVMEQLVQTGKVRRGRLGVGIQAVTEEIAEQFDIKDRRGVLVNQIQTGSAAEKAGIKRDDVIVAINGERVEDTNTLRNKVAGTLPGNEIKVTVVRDGKEQDFNAKLDELESGKLANEKPDDDKKDDGKANENGKLGLSLQPATPEMLKQLGMPADTKGLIVTDVDESGAAAEKGIARGDVILEINKKPVGTLEDAQSALAQAGDRPVILLISRKNQTVYIPVTPGR